ncbi:MAG: rhamnulokinase [Armatimonadetes bacterium]|nr:rhamnulokinase [Armatimonadota bacterium]
MAEAKFLAFDLGAESGRGVLGFFDGRTLRLEDVHRFPNGPVRILGSMHWDALRLFGEMKEALRLAVHRYGAEIEGIGVDTWGVDFGLIGRGDVLLGNPYHYRDKRTDGMMEEAFRRMPREEIFEHTGIQFMKLNTVYQLLAMVVQKSPLLEIAETLLMMPDLFHFWFTGCKVSEFTEATTSQFYDPRAGGWSKPLCEQLGLPYSILPEITKPGTVIGELLPSVAQETGAGAVPVIAPASHDTGSAVAAVPAQTGDYAYISSGTWSLMGIEAREPIINSRSLALNFTNEGGVCGTFRFLKNIMGLWLVQECRRTWARAGEDLSYSDLADQAASAKPFGFLIEPDHSAFLSPGDMPAEIRRFCRQTGQPEPESKGEIIRCSLESLALKYRWTVESLEQILGKRLSVIHLVGGGTQNRLLSQFTADATGRPAVAGPIEATAIGNILMQALARGYVSSLSQAREVVRNSFEVITYEPRNTAAWDEAYGRYLNIREKAEVF